MLHLSLFLPAGKVALLSTIECDNFKHLEYIMFILSASEHDPCTPVYGIVSARKARATVFLKGKQRTKKYSVLDRPWLHIVSKTNPLAGRFPRVFFSARARVGVSQMRGHAFSSTGSEGRCGSACAPTCSGRGRRAQPHSPGVGRGDCLECGIQGLGFRG